MKILYKLYFAIPSFRRFGLGGKAVDKIFGIILKRLLDSFVPTHYSQSSGKLSGISDDKGENPQIIVSLTSFPARIEQVWICIESILRQSFKPDKIILWLAEEQFPEKRLPKNLLELQRRGLTIEYCKDIRSHKKYYFAMKKYPKASVITMDDDVYYPSNTLEHLICNHHRFPDCIIANRAHLVTHKYGNILPYRQWKHNFKSLKEPSHRLVPTGVGGVLYPPGSLHPDVFNMPALLRLCPNADDLWLKIHALRKGTSVKSTVYFNKDLVSIGTSQKERLLTKNSFGGGNDEQLRALFKHYSIKSDELWEKIDDNRRF